MNISDRQPPRDKQAEIFVMCCCLLDGRCIDKVALDDFYGEASDFPGWLYGQVEQAWRDSDGRVDHASILFRRCMASQQEIKRRFGVDCIPGVLGRIVMADGYVAKIDEYLRRCREAKQYRDRVTDLTLQLVQAYTEWDNYYAFTQNMETTNDN